MEAIEMTVHLFPADMTAQVREPRRGRGRVLARKFVGGFYLCMGGVHLGIVAADAGFYRPFADDALFTFVTTGWNDVFMSHPAAWGLVMAMGETALGVSLLSGHRWAKAGWLGVIGFHVALMLFGWGFWLWSVPALALLVPAAVADWRGGAR